MALSPRLEFRQSQTLTLTPQLMQSIRLLQLSHLELSAFVDDELLRNPLLEREDGGTDEAPEPAEPRVEMSAYEDTVASSDRIKDADQIAEGYDTAVENVFPDSAPSDLGSSAAGPDRNGSFDGGDAPDLDQFIATRPRLSDHLEAQAHMLLRTQADRLIAQHLIDGLNEAGYLAIELEQVAVLLGAEIEDVEAVLAVLQTCDPVGIFARTVAECLSMQLRASAIGGSIQ
ncbi:RNA polymerase factor sigma-54 [Devosia aurantiaca]|uniref:RNA polymerase factor sigma-54 n=1 Tax=Devosia aurantiaca TaxID=2714858 RepID=UPI0038B2848E